MSTHATWNQATHTLKIIDDKKPQPDHLRALHNGLLSDLMEAIMAGSVPERDQFRKALGLLPEQIILTIDYGKSLEEMIAAGGYDWRNEILNAEFFPIKGGGVVEVEARLFHFAQGLQASKEGVKRIREADTGNPWEPARTEHLLAFGAACPDEQRRYPIVALGSTGMVDGDRRMPWLGIDDAERRLDLDWWDSVLLCNFRFLAVRKKVSRSTAS